MRWKSLETTNIEDAKICNKCGQKFSIMKSMIIWFNPRMKYLTNIIQKKKIENDEYGFDFEE